MKFGLEEAPSSERWLATVLALTARYGETFYDAAYQAVALVYGGVFVTADTSYVTLVQKEGAIVSLSEWHSPNSETKHRG